MATSPFGTNVRAIVISVDPDRLRSYDLTPDDVVSAIHEGNFISPSGNVYIQDEMPLVPNNAMISNPQGFRQYSGQVGRECLCPRCRHDFRCDRSELWLCAGQRPQVGLLADCQKEHCFDTASRERHPQVDAAFQKRSAR